jgi:hypothetical protein
MKLPEVGNTTKKGEDRGCHHPDSPPSPRVQLVPVMASVDADATHQTDHWLLRMLVRTNSMKQIDTAENA